MLKTYYMQKDDDTYSMMSYIMTFQSSFYFNHISLKLSLKCGRLRIVTETCIQILEVQKCAALNYQYQYFVIFSVKIVSLFIETT